MGNPSNSGFFTDRTDWVGRIRRICPIRSKVKILSSGYRFSLGRSKKESHFAAIRFVFLGKEQLHLMILKKQALGFCKWSVAYKSWFVDVVEGFLRAASVWECQPQSSSSSGHAPQDLDHSNDKGDEFRGNKNCKLPAMIRDIHSKETAGFGSFSRHSQAPKYSWWVFVETAGFGGLGLPVRTNTLNHGYGGRESFGSVVLLFEHSTQRAPGTSRKTCTD